MQIALSSSVGSREPAPPLGTISLQESRAARGEQESEVKTREVGNESRALMPDMTLRSRGSSLPDSRAHLFNGARTRVWLICVLTPLILADRKSTRLNSSHRCISYAVFCLKKKKKNNNTQS